VRLFPFVIATFFLLAGCAAKNQPQKNAGVSPVTLTKEQVQIVEAGVMEMIENPADAAFSAKSAISIAGAPGVHVCGYVKYIGQDLPYYLELRDKDGKPVAERGQVGTEPSKASKVTFMCRRNG